MGWFIQKDGKIISKEYPTKDQAVIEATEKGLVLKVLGKLMLSEGTEVVEVSKKPNAGDRTWNDKEGGGKIKFLTEHQNFAWVESPGDTGFYIDCKDLVWNIEEGMWNYPSLEEKPPIPNRTT